MDVQWRPFVLLIPPVLCAASYQRSALAVALILCIYGGIWHLLFGETRQKAS